MLMIKVYMYLFFILCFTLQGNIKLPPPPINLPKFTERVQFGKEMRKKHFYLDVCVHVVSSAHF